MKCLGCLLLQHAKDLMIAADTRSGGTFIFKDYNGRIQRALKDAEKDNDLIYHARVPDVKTLAVVGKAAVAKSTPPASPMSSNFTGNHYGLLEFKQTAYHISAMLLSF